MADKKKMSVEEILAAARKADSRGGGAANPPAASTPGASGGSASAGDTGADHPAGEAATPAPAPATPAGGARKPAGQMTTADILAAARAKPGAAAGESGAAPSAESKPAPAKPAAKPAAAKAPGAMSTADILAAARAGKAAAGGADKPAPAAKPAAEKPAARPAAAKAGTEKAAAAKPAAPDKGAAAGGPKDTASILAAARGAAKPGPVSKAEAAAREKQMAAAVGAKKKEIPPMPEKPAYAQPRPQAAPRGEDRRGFFRGIVTAFSGSALAVGFSSLAVTANLWALGLARFMFPNILIEPPTKFKVGFPDELAPGQVQTKFVPQFGVWIVRYEYDGQPQIYALQTVCTHLGCTPNWLEGEQKFKCPCHGSGFYKDGINFEGPAPRPLERFAIRLADDGQLEVDKSRKFKEEMGQWRDPNSFVPV